MIAIFIPSLEKFVTAQRVIPTATREVDGPFRYLDAGRVRLYLVTEGADASYAAARLAIRRGAEVLVPIVEAFTTERLAEEEGLELGSVVSVTGVWNLDGLRPLLAILPDSAAELPLDPDQLIDNGAVWKADSKAVSVGVGTLPHPTRNRRLMRHLSQSLGTLLYDVQISGYIDAALECGVGKLLPLAEVTTLVGRSETRELDAVTADAAFGEMLATLMERR
jgi:hypothetical protein